MRPFLRLAKSSIVGQLRPLSDGFPISLLPCLCYNNFRRVAFGGAILEPLEIARKAVEAASEKQASNIVLLDTSKVCSFADYFLICSAESERQIRAVQDEIEGALKKEGAVPLHLEGTADSGWLLLDYGGVIIHVFAPPQREYYRLDELWSSATPILQIQ